MEKRREIDFANVFLCLPSNDESNTVGTVLQGDENNEKRTVS